MVSLYSSTGSKTWKVTVPHKWKLWTFEPRVFDGSRMKKYFGIRGDTRKIEKTCYVLAQYKNALLPEVPTEEGINSRSTRKTPGWIWPNIRENLWTTGATTPVHRSPAILEGSPENIVETEQISLDLGLVKLTVIARAKEKKFIKKCPTVINRK